MLPSLIRWSWRWDLNPQPADYKSAALPIELRQPIVRSTATPFGIPGIKPHCVGNDIYYTPFNGKVNTPVSRLFAFYTPDAVSSRSTKAPFCGRPAPFRPRFLHIVKVHRFALERRAGACYNALEGAPCAPPDRAFPKRAMQPPEQRRSAPHERSKGRYHL